jgi:hypothetical protein
MKRSILIVAGIVALFLAVHAVTSGDHKKPETETVTLGGQGHKELTLPPAAQHVAESQQAQDAAGHEQAAHSDLRTEPPASKTPQVLEHNRQVAPSGQPTPPATIPLATVNTPGCRTLPVRNQSSRAGAPSLLIVLHQTISADNGWAGVLGNVKWFDTSAAQASSNYIVARTGGQCAYIVPEAAKAWAQAGFNRVVPCSIEVTETGREGSYLPAGSAGRARVLSLLEGCSQRWHIPLRHGAVSGCSVLRSGVVEHFDLKACGGGHVDDSPYHAEVDKLIAQAAAAVRPAVPPASAVRSHKILHAKIRARCHKHPRPAGCTVLFQRLGALHAKYPKLPS